MQRGRLLKLVLLAACAASTCGCATWSSSRQAPPPPTSATERTAWWKSNKNKAVFVPGKGYSLAGIPGYLDDNGRPMEGDSGRPIYDPPANAKSDFVEGSVLDNVDPQEIYKKIQKSMGGGPNASASAQRQQEGNALFEQKKYDEAAEKYEQAIKIAADATADEEATFMLAESYFFADRYPYANDTYSELVKKYPSTRYMDKVVTRQFAMARYWQQMHASSPHWPTTPILWDKTRYKFDTKGHAIRTYDNIRMNDPTGPLADDALMATANSYFLSGYWDDADYHYALLRSEYPDSEYQFQAHLLGLQCKLRLYQGADYEGTPLEEAKKLADQLLKQFPDQIASERERVQKTRLEIAAMLAGRDWRLGEYYAAHDAYGAARFYYNHIITEYPDTKLAEDARRRVGEFQAEPDVPEQKFEWLVKLFPEGQKRDLVAEQAAIQQAAAATGTERR